MRTASLQGMRRSFRFLIAAAVALLVALFFKSVFFESSNETLNAQDPNLRHSGDRAPAAIADAIPFDPNSLEAVEPKAEEKDKEFRYEDFLESVERHVPELKDYFVLSEKQLRQEAEKEKFKQVIADPQLFRDTLSKLDAFPSSSEDEDRARFVMLKFVQESLAWTDNPVHAHLSKEFKDYLFRDPRSKASELDRLQLSWWSQQLDESVEQQRRQREEQ